MPVTLTFQWNMRSQSRINGQNIFRSTKGSLC